MIQQTAAGEVTCASVRVPAVLWWVDERRMLALWMWPIF